MLTFDSELSEAPNKHFSAMQFEYINRFFFCCSSVPSAVQNRVGPHNADDLPRAVAVLVLQLFMEEIQIACKKWKSVERELGRRDVVSSTK